MTAVAVFFLVICAVFYFLPSMVAYQNKKDDIVAIVFLNVLVGWTFIGWVIALVWAFTKNKK